MSWSAYLLFIDKINKKQIEIEHSFNPVYKYNDLFKDIEMLYALIGWEIKYCKKNVVFKLATYLDAPTKVDDWDNYILNHDNIQVILYDSTIIEYGLFTEDNDLIIQTYKPEIIYGDIDYEKIDQPLLLYTVTENGDKLKLIDVIDNPQRMYNDLVNRMVKKGW